MATKTDFVQFEDQSSTPATPGTGLSRVFSKSDGLYVVDDEGNVTGPFVDSTSGSGEFTEQSTVKLTTGDLTTTSTTFTDATGLSVTLTTAAVRCLVIFSGLAKNSGVTTTAFDLAIDGTRQGQTYGLSAMGGTDGVQVGFTYLTDVLSAASHTIKIQWRVDGGTGTLRASTTICPAILTVIETSMAS